MREGDLNSDGFPADDGGSLDHHEQPVAADQRGELWERGRWPPENYLDFAQRIGRPTARTASGLWYGVASRVWEPFPFCGVLRPSREEVRELLVTRRFFAMRFPVSAEDIGFSSVRYVCRTAGYDFCSLKPKARNQTRRGMDAHVVREVPLADLRSVGWDAFRETLIRQRRRLARSTERRWSLFCREAARTQGFRAWGAFGARGLAAFLVVFRAAGCCHVLLLRSRQRELMSYPNNALVFRVTQELLKLPGVDEVSFGWSSLRRDLASLGHFKLGMGFEATPARQRILLHPALAPITHLPMVQRLFLQMIRLSGSETRAKLEGAFAALRASSC